MALLLWPWGTSRLYSNSVWNQFCSVSMASYVVGAPSVTDAAAVATEEGKSSGSSR